MNDESSPKETSSQGIVSATINALNNIQNVLGVVLASGALATATGFLVVNSLLLKYDFFVSLSILPSEYIGAGIIVWIIVVLAVLTNLASLALLSVFVSLLFVVFQILKPKAERRAITIHSILPQRIMSLVAANLPKSVASRLASKFPKYPLFLLLNTVFWGWTVPFADDNELVDSLFVDKFLNTVPAVAFILLTLSVVGWSLSLYDDNKLGIVLGLGTNAYSIFLALSTAALLILSLGFDLYLYIPKSWGGGSPIPINLFLDKEINGVYLGIEVDEDGMSENVCLLAEMFEGLFLYNPRTARSIVLSTGSQSAYIGHAASQDSISCAPPDSSAGIREICSLVQSETNGVHRADASDCSQATSGS